MKTAEMTLLIPETPQEREFLARLYQEYGRHLLEGGGLAQAAEASGEEELAGAYTGEKGEQNLRRLLTEVHGEKARRALRAIADETLDGKTPPDSDTIRRRLGMETGEGVANKLGGVLTSVGFALKRTGLERPYKDGWSGDRVTYSMDAAVAQMIRELLNKDGSLK